MLVAVVVAVVVVVGGGGDAGGVVDCVSGSGCIDCCFCWCGIYSCNWLYSFVSIVVSIDTVLKLFNLVVLVLIGVGVILVGCVLTVVVSILIGAIVILVGGVDVSIVVIDGVESN